VFADWSVMAAAPHPRLPPFTSRWCSRVCRFHEAAPFVRCGEAALCSLAVCVSLAEDAVAGNLADAREWLATDGLGGAGGALGSRLRHVKQTATSAHQWPWTVSADDLTKLVSAAFGDGFPSTGGSSLAQGGGARWLAHLHPHHSAMDKSALRFTSQGAGSPWASAAAPGWLGSPLGLAQASRSVSADPLASK
jgi:hypothetical protein